MQARCGEPVAGDYHVESYRGGDRGSPGIFEWQAADLEVTFMQKVLLGDGPEHSPRRVGHPHQQGSRWVITGGTNLYSQERPRCAECG